MGGDGSSSYLFEICVFYRVEGRKVGKDDWIDRFSNEL